MNDPTNWFDVQRFSRLRLERGATWGRPLRLLDETASTNDVALNAIASEDKTGIVWLARRQTGGRGRRGNVWFAEPGRNLTLSILLRIPGPHHLAAGFPLVAGLAVRAVVAARLPLGCQAQVKWPNDVLIDARKCAGVLVESRTTANGQLGVVVGVGLNVATRDFPATLPDATSLALCDVPPKSMRLEDLLVDFLVELERRTRTHLERGLGSLLEELEQHDFLRGKQVKVGELHGEAAGFAADGQLRLERADGAVSLANVGHVELVASPPHSGANSNG